MKKIITFVILVFLLSTPGYLLYIYANKLGISESLSISIIMFMPMVSAFIVKLIFDKSLRGFGWKLGSIKWLVLSYLIPIAFGGIAYLFLISTGLAKSNPAYHVSLLKLVSAFWLFNFFTAAGEEIGWRGFLFPELMKITSFNKSCFITGIIWAVWHFPGLIFGSYLSSIPLIALLPFFLITLIGMSFVMGWLRAKSGSVWTGVIYHATHNNFLQMLFIPLALPTLPISKYFLDETGLAMLIVVSVFTLIFWKLFKWSNIKSVEEN
jgi:uncharacterized protein